MASGLGVIGQIEERHSIIRKDFQKAVYLNILGWLDVFMCVQTGSTKTYCLASLSELFPLVHKAEWPIDNNLLIILPLSGLMLEYTSRLNDLGELMLSLS